MQSPNYRWLCHKCESVNASGVGTCAQCGFAATATAEEIAKAKGEPSPTGKGYRALSPIAWLLLLIPPPLS